MNDAAMAGPQLVLVGGGHSHVQVLRRFAMERSAKDARPARLTLVVDRPVAFYSGMVPGFVAGMYRREELEIDLLPLARRAGARVIFAEATRVDAAARRLELAGRPAIPYDLLSFNIGSSVQGLDLPGVREAAIATRPSARLIQSVDELLGRWRAMPPGQRPDPLRVVVVGAGSGGVELAFTLKARLEAAGMSSRIGLVQTGLFVLPGYSPSFRQKVENAARQRGIELVLGRRAMAVDGEVLRLDAGPPLPFDALFWVTGAAAPEIFRRSGLPVDEKGFLLLRKTLQAVGHDEIFAAGDCATLTEAPSAAKAGVYAVRHGPVLTSNLRAKLGGEQLDAYLPQSDFLTLLNLGDGTAIGAKWGFSFEGRWVMRWKDRIDRRFMERFQVLRPGGEPSPHFPGMSQPAIDGTGEMVPMYCGGGAAKVGQNVLERVFRRLPPPPADPSVVFGLDPPDDAAAFNTPGGDLVLVSLDAFKAFTPDPWLVGKVAAIHALSDIYAKGAAPAHALALVSLPEGLGEEGAEEMLWQVLEGIRSVLDPLGVSLVGGHTTLAAELTVGLSALGALAAGDAPLRKGRLELGQRLILTKRLGTGVILHADPLGWVPGPWLEQAYASMLRPNAEAAAIARRMGATAATDVTGFGLLGHLGEMARASAFSVAVDVDLLPALPGALELFARGLQSTAHAQNEKLLVGTVIDHAASRHGSLPLLADPQTSGGLLLAVPAEKAEEAALLLHEAGDEAACVIGEVLPARIDGAKIRLRCRSSTTAD
jgi:selenide,water dikinase